MKHKITSLLFITGIVYTASFAQPVIQSQKTIGGSADDKLWSICLTRDGGLIAGGISYSNISGEKNENSRGSDDYWVVKMDKPGKMQWQRTIGGSGDDNLKSVIQTSDGGYALIGESSSNISGEKTENSRGGTDYWLVKLDSLGRIQWDRTFGGSGYEYIDNVVQTTDGGYILAGSSESYISGDKSESTRGYFDYWVVRLNKKGDKVWDKTIGGTDYEFCSPIELTTDGGVIIGGFSQSNISGEKTENSRGFYDYWLVKLDRYGHIKWDKTIGGSDNDFGRGLKQTDDGGYIMTGSSYSSYPSGDKTDYGRGGADYWVVKLDSKGNLLWDKTIGGDADDNEVWCLEKTSDGGYIFGGNSYSGISGEKTESNRGDADYWVVKIDGSGNKIWDKTIGGTGYDGLYSIKELSGKRYAIGGYSYSGISGDKTQESRGGADYWVVNLYDKTAAPEISSAVNENSLNMVAASNSSNFRAYPNPAKDLLNVQVSTKSIVAVTDISGKVLLTQSIEGKTSINVSSFTPGMYYLKNITTGEVQKFVITK